MITKILIFGYYSLFIEFVLAQYIFLFNAKKRKYFIWMMIGFLIAGSGFYFLPSLDYFDFNWSYSIVFLTTALLGFALYDASWQTILTCSITGYALQHLTWNALELFYETVYPDESTLSQGGALAYYFAFYIIFYLVTFLIIWKRKVFLDFNIISVPAIIAALGILIVSLILSEKIQSWNYILRLYSIITSLFAILIVGGAFKLSSNQKEQIRLEEKNKMLENMIIEKANQQKIAKETIDLINMKAHDMKNQIAVLKGLNKQEQNTYIEEISKTVDIYNNIAKTGNEVLDIVLTQKSLLCSSKKIKFTYICDGKIFQSFDSSDISALFANLIDNAIEGVEKEDINNRIIKLNVSLKGSFVTIHVENYCPHEVTFKKGLPLTTKKDKNNHGFGVQSIMYIAQKYKGNATFSYKDHIFSANIILPYKS